MDGRATNIDAVSTTRAFVMDDPDWLARMVVLDQHAGLVGDDDRGFGNFRFLAQRPAWLGFKQSGIYAVVCWGKSVKQPVPLSNFL
jgi:hypothetical protein